LSPDRLFPSRKPAADSFRQRRIRVARDPSRALPLHDPQTILPFLYVTSETLQISDAYSTFKAAHLRRVEANPFVGTMMGNAALFVGVKTAATLTTFLAAEHMWKNHHRKAAIATMVVANAILAGVAVNNANVLGRLQR
jgi:hypothetical protein